MKKAGIVVSVVLVLLALSIFLIANKIESKKATQNKAGVTQEVKPTQKQASVKKKTPTKVPTQKVEKESKEEEKVAEVTEKATPTPEKATPTSKEETKKVEKTTEITTLSAESLGKPIKMLTEKATIIGKRVVLLDEQYGTKNGKMLTYCFDLITETNVTLSLFTTGSVYNTCDMYSEMEVVYNVYENKNKVEFPVIIKATALTRGNSKE